MVPQQLSITPTLLLWISCMQEEAQHQAELQQQEAEACARQEELHKSEMQVKKQLVQQYQQQQQEMQQQATAEAAAEAERAATAACAEICAAKPRVEARQAATAERIQQQQVRGAGRCHAPGLRGS